METRIQSVLETAHWEELMYYAVKNLLSIPNIKKSLPEGHFEDTPSRVVKAFQEYFSGAYKDPAEVLSTAFEEASYDQMIVVSEVDFVSWCAHHLCPFIGTYTFAYIPKKHIVGLSKIPRMVEVLCARPQVQENLSQEIVNVFHDKVVPKGCGIVMDAIHTCTCTRGVKKKFNTRTTALAGNFKQDSVKAEFLTAVGAK